MVSGAINVGALVGSLEWNDNATRVLRGFQNVVDQTAARMGRVGDSFEKTGYQFTQAGQHISRVGDRLTMLSVGMGAVAVASIKMSTTFQTELTKVANITEIGEEAFTRMRGAILKMAPEVGRGPNELAQGLYAIGSVGIRGAEALEALERSSKASAVGLGLTEDVARAVTAAMINYADEGMTAARATDILFSAVKEGGAEADQFANVLGRVIATAKSAGVSFEEVTASVATFTRLGVRADEAVTALRGTMALVQKPSEGAKNELLKLGTSIEQVRDKVRKDGLADALIELVKLTKGNEDAIGRIIPNVRSLAGVLANAGSQAEAYNLIVNKNYKSAGELDKAFERLSETTGFKLQVFWARVQTLAIATGDQLAPALVKLIDAVTPLFGVFTGLVNVFAALPAPIQTTVLALGGMTILMGPLLSFGGRFIELLGLLIGQRGLASLANWLAVAATAFGIKTKAIEGSTAAMVANQIVAARQVIVTTALSTASGILAAAWGLLANSAMVTTARMLLMQGPTILLTALQNGLAAAFNLVTSSSLVMGVRMAAVSVITKAVGQASLIAGGQIAGMGVAATATAVAKAILAGAMNLVTGSATVLGIRLAATNLIVRAIGLASTIAGGQIAGMGVAATISATAQAGLATVMGLVSSAATVLGIRMALANAAAMAAAVGARIATAANNLWVISMNLVTGSATVMGIRLGVTTGLAGLWARAATLSTGATTALAAAFATLSTAIGTLLGIGIVVGLLWAFWEASKKAVDGVMNLINAWKEGHFWATVFERDTDNWLRRAIGLGDGAKQAAQQMQEAARMMRESEQESLVERLSGADVQKRIDSLGVATTKLNQNGQLVANNYRRIAAEAERIAEAAKAAGGTVTFPKWLQDIVDKWGSTPIKGPQVTLGGQAPNIDMIDARINEAQRKIEGLSQTVRDKLVRAMTVGRLSAQELHKELGASSPGEMALEMLQQKALGAANAIKGTTSWVQRLKNEAGTLENELQAGMAAGVPEIILWEEFGSQIEKVTNRIPLVKGTLGAATLQMSAFGKSLEYTTFKSKQAAEWQDAYNNIVEEGIKKMQRWGEATARNAQAMTRSDQNIQDMWDSLLPDTLDNRIAGIEKEFSRLIAAIPQEELLAGLGTERVIKLQEEMQTKIRVTTETWLRGNALTRDDLGRLAMDAEFRFREMQRSGRFSAEDVRAAWQTWYDLDKQFRGDYGPQWVTAFGIVAQAAQSVGQMIKGVWGQIVQGAGNALNSFASLGDAMAKHRDMMAGMAKGVKFSFTDILGSVTNGVMGMIGLVTNAVGIVQGILDHFSNRANRNLRAQMVRDLGGAMAGGVAAAMAGIKDWDAFLRDEDVSKGKIASITRQIQDSQRALQAYGLTWKDFRTDIAQLGLDQVVRTLVKDFNSLVTAGANPEKVLKGMSSALNQLVIDAVETGTKIPVALQPMLESLIRTGQLSEEAARSLLGLSNEAVPSLASIEEAAKRYGLTLDQLGDKVAQIRITETADQIAKDWKLLVIDLQADGNMVAQSMRDSVQRIVTDALRMGLDIPAALEPVIQTLINAGGLTDEFGNALTDTSRLNFVKPIAEKIDELIAKLQELIDAWSNVGTAAEDAGRRMTNPATGLFDRMAMGPPTVQAPAPGAPGPAPTAPPAPKEGGTTPNPTLPTAPPTPPFGPNLDAADFANTGGVIRAGRLLKFPLVSARHFAGGGSIMRTVGTGRLLDFQPFGQDTVPIMARPDEIILNTAQQKPVAEAIARPGIPSAQRSTHGDSWNANDWVQHERNLINRTLVKTVPEGDRPDATRRYPTDTEFGPMHVEVEQHFSISLPNATIRSSEDAERVAHELAEIMRKGGDARTVLTEQIINVVNQAKGLKRIS
jgi:TP901 family phage tail tape measure protein